MLAQTMVLLLVLALISVSLLRLMLGRGMTVAKVQSSAQARVSSFGIEGKVFACLQAFPPATCTRSAFTAAQQACIGQVESDTGAQISFGAGPSGTCKLAIAFNN